MATASLNRSLVGRAVHIKIYPRPRTITESREVLHILERYGEVTMYRNLKVCLYGSVNCKSPPADNTLNNC